MKNNIYLIGMMGSGKSTIGRLLSENLYYRFIDADDYLVDHSDYDSINEIFLRKSEKYFRTLENEVMKELSTFEKTIVATGGGVILDNQNIEMMQSSGLVVYLKSSIDNLVQRLKGSENRPLLKDVDLEKKLNALDLKRNDKYLEASDLIVDISFKEKEVIVEEIIKLLAGDYNEYISD